MALQYDRSQEEAESGKYGIVLGALKPARRVLEVGCHTGYFLEVLNKHGFQAKGFEFDKEAIEVAKSKGLDVDWANAEDPRAFQVESKFDAILLLDVLEHLRNPEETLESMRNALSEKGRLLITVPNIAYWAMRKDLLFGKWQYTDSGILDRTHLRFYNLNGWKKLFETTRYRVKQVAVADSMLICESRLKRLPILGSFIEMIKKPLVQTFPNFFAISFFFELEC